MPGSYADAQASGLDSLACASTFHCIHGAFESEPLQFSAERRTKSTKTRLLCARKQRTERIGGRRSAAGRAGRQVARRSGRDGSCTRRTEWMGGWRSAADRMDGRVVQTTVAYLSVVADEHISYLKAAYAKSKPQLV